MLLCVSTIFCPILSYSFISLVSFFYKQTANHLFTNKQLTMSRLTLSALSSGTFSMSASYIFLFWKAFRSTIRRNVCRSSAHKVPSTEAWIVAALGTENMKKCEIIANETRYKNFILEIKFRSKQVSKTSKLVLGDI